MAVVVLILWWATRDRTARYKLKKYKKSKSCEEKETDIIARYKQNSETKGRIQNN